MEYILKMKLVKKEVFGIYTAIFVLIFIHVSHIQGQEYKITNNNIKFIDYPDFPMAHSTWSDIGYNSKYNTVYVGVTNHVDSIGLYEYSAEKGVMVNKGFINHLANLRDYQWQGKIHTKIAMGPDGCMYFATDGGESREEYLMENPHGYGGGFFMKWDPSLEKLTSLGVGLQYESIKDVDIDFETGYIYAITYPQVHFLIYNPKTNQLHDLGRLGSPHVPRVMFTDSWGNCYYVDWRQRLVMYDKSIGKLLFARESLPAFEGTPGSKIVTGIKTFAKVEKSNIIYLATFGAKILAFHPQKSGIGKVEDLGGLLPEGYVDQPWKPVSSNLNVGDNGKLYYVIGGHGNFAKNGKTLFMEFDPQKKEYRFLFEFATSEVAEVTGSSVKDKEGNLYFAARKDIQKRKGGVSAEGQTTEHSSSPFMIKFNPVKEVKR
jgi:hypothetical protein